MKYNNGSVVKNYPVRPMAEQQPNVLTDEAGGNKTDPSVRLGALRGEPNGSVPLERTMAKPQAYKAKAGPK